MVTNMIPKLLALPVFYILSRIVEFVGLIGGVVNPTPIFAKIFDWTIGFKNAKQMRDEHAKSLVPAVESREIDYDVSKQVLIKETEKQRQESIARITRGESIVSIIIAVLALWVGELPSEIHLPLDATVPLIPLDTILLLLVSLLVASVFFREVSVQAQAFTSPSVFESYDELMTKMAWNGGTLSQTRVLYNTLVLQILREWDMRFYELYLELIADYVEQDGIPLFEAMERYGSDAYEIVQDKYGF